MLLYYFENEKNSIVENMNFELGTGNNISAAIKLFAQSTFIKKLLHNYAVSFLVEELALPVCVFFFVLLTFCCSHVLHPLCIHASTLLLVLSFSIKSILFF